MYLGDRCHLTVLRGFSIRTLRVSGNDVHVQGVMKGVTGLERNNNPLGPLG